MREAGADGVNAKPLALDIVMALGVYSLEPVS